MDMKPFADALLVLKRLKKLKPLHVITSRQECLRERTLNWIKKYFPGIFSEVDFGNLYSFEGGTVKKSELCRISGIELLVEDDAKHAVEIAKEIPVILFAKPWNQNFQAENVTKARAWGEIAKIARKILNQSSQS